MTENIAEISSVFDAEDIPTKEDQSRKYGQRLGEALFDYVHSKSFADRRGARSNFAKVILEEFTYENDDRAARAIEALLEYTDTKKFPFSLGLPLRHLIGINQ